jgi:hypothetical protein
MSIMPNKRVSYFTPQVIVGSSLIRVAIFSFATLSPLHIDIAKAITKEILGKDGKAEFVEVTSKTRIPLLKKLHAPGDRWFIFDSRRDIFICDAFSFTS